MLLESLVAFTTLLPFTAEGESCLALGGYDPVSLSRGVEEKGLGSIEESRHVYFYRFANEENRKAFQADPERYEIQLGGGCGRMGPLSGKGDPSRYVVHAGRTYVFASDVCRDAFLQAPEQYLDPDEVPPGGDPAVREEGKALIAKAVEAVGGRDRLAKLRAFQVGTSTQVETKTGSRTDTIARTIVFPDGQRLDQTWGDWRGSYVMGDGQAFYLGNDGTAEDIHAAAQRELRRASLRQPLVILRASSDPEFVAVATGPAKSGDVEVEEVAIGIEGTATVLGIDPKTGRILTVAYRGRTERQNFAPIVRTYSDFRDEGGLVLPHKERTAVDGKDAGPERSLEVRVDPALPAKFLEKP